MQLKGKRAVHDLKQTGWGWPCVYRLPVQGTPTMQVRSLGQEAPPEEEMLVFLPGEPHGQRSQAGCSAWGRREEDTTEHACTHVLRRRVLVFGHLWSEWAGK